MYDKMNRRNLKHGMAGTSTYYAWQNLKRTPGGVCARWQRFANFLADLGPKPTSSHWLFRIRPYQRSRPGNVSWSVYARQFKDIWQYLTPDELVSCYRHIKVLCVRAGYDFDVGINELYLQDLAGVQDPSARTHSWIKRYLPRILAVLKKQRGEIRYNDEAKYEH